MQNSKGLLGGISEWMTPERGIALQGLGTILTQLDAGQPVNASPAYNALLQRQQRAERDRALNESGLLERFSPEQRAILAQMEPGAAQQVIAQTLFREPKAPEPVKGVNMNGRLVNPITGEMIADYSTPEQNDIVRIVTGDEANKFGLDPAGTWELSFNPDMTLKNASALGTPSTSVDVAVDAGTRQETEYDKVRGKSFGDLANTISADSRSATRTITALDAMERTMGADGFYSGVGSGGVAFAKRVGSALGLDTEGIEDMETFNALAKGAALDAMGGSLGAGFSNADRDFVLDQVPQLNNSPEGNALLIEVQRAMAKRKQEIAKLARDYERENERLDLGFEDLLAEWGDANPVFTDEWFAATREKISVAIDGPQPGMVEDGYRFKGGDPANPDNWERVD